MSTADRETYIVRLAGALLSAMSFWRIKAISESVAMATSVAL